MNTMKMELTVRETGEIVMGTIVVGRDEVAVLDNGSTVSIVARFPMASGIVYETLFSCEKSSTYNAKEAALRTIEAIANGMDEEEIADHMHTMRTSQLLALRAVRPLIAA
jgi:hypothetical protein